MGVQVGSAKPLLFHSGVGEHEGGEWAEPWIHPLNVLGNVAVLVVRQHILHAV